MNLKKIGTALTYVWIAVVVFVLLSFSGDQYSGWNELRIVGEATQLYVYSLPFPIGWSIYFFRHQKTKYAIYCLLALILAPLVFILSQQ